MSLTFHHFFVFVSKEHSEDDFLRKNGFSEGSRNIHPGQGTANRRVFFENGMLEFIWADDISELRNLLTTPTQLYERSHYKTSGFSPFGICVCPLTNEAPVVAEPFLGWPYQPRYIPKEGVIWHGSTHPKEPAMIYMSFLKPICRDVSTKEPIQHANGAQAIKTIAVTMESALDHLSDAAQTLQSDSVVTFVSGRECLAEITMKAATKATIDFSEWCPLKIYLEP